MTLADDAATYHAALLADDLALARLHHLRGWTPDALTRLGVGIDGHRVTIPVRDAHGNVVNILRYAPNPARRNGPKVLSEKGAPRHLFPRPEDVEGDYVVLVEGEADAITAHSFGIPAVGIPGVQTTRPAAASFAGKDVLVLFDNDDPGQKAAGEWAKALCRVATVKRGAWPCDGDDLGDVWKRDPEAFRATFAAVEDAAKVVSPPMLPIESFGDFTDSVGPRDETRNYLGAMFRGGQRTHVIGPIGHGKTTFMAEATSAAVYGRDFLGLKGRGGIRALYIDLEMPRELLLVTLQAARFDPASPLFDVVSLPDGLAVDENAEHREMIENSIQGYHVVVIDPWYKLIADELSEGMRKVRTVISFLDALRQRNPRTAVVVGFHANEAQKGAKLGGLGDASGFKAFQRPADTAVVFQRVRGDRSRLVWVKTRDPELPKMGDEWLLNWTRGQGFERVERRRTADDVREQMVDGWQTVYDLCEMTGLSRSRIAHVLAELHDEGRVEKRTVGRRTEWCPADPGQEVLAA